MSRLAARWSRLWNEHWFRPAPAFDLGLFRAIVAGFQTFVLFFPNALLMYPPYTTYAELAAYPAERFDPPWLLKLLMLPSIPFGGDGRPSVELLTLAYRVAMVSGILATIGLFARTSCLLLGLASLLLVTHQFSYGEHHHVEAMLLIALLLLAVSRSGDAVSVDSWWRQRRRTVAGKFRSPDPHTRQEGAEEVSKTSPRQYGWPMRVVQWLLAITYLSSALCKIGGGGLEWFNGTTLQYYVLQDALLWDLDAGRWLADRHGLCVAVSWIVVLVEGLFFLVLIQPRTALVLVPLAAAMHVGIWVTMRAPFFYYFPLFAAFVPWSRLLRRLRVDAPPAPEGRRRHRRGA